MSESIDSSVQFIAPFVTQGLVDMRGLGQPSTVKALAYYLYLYSVGFFFQFFGCFEFFLVSTNKPVYFLTEFTHA